MQQDQRTSLHGLSGKGTYAVVLHTVCDSIILAGRLGEIRLAPGYYIYVGSAFGSGGLRARLQHHLKISHKPHWHLDYLRPHAEITALWYTFDPCKREHHWATALASLKGMSAPHTGFGSSDCHCTTHLWFSNKPPSYRRFRWRLGKQHPEHRQVKVLKLQSA